MALDKHRRKLRKLWIAALLGGLFLPTLTLIPLGSFWLWQNGFLLIWAAAAVVCVISMLLLQNRLINKRKRAPDKNLVPDASTGSRDVETSWTPAERQAWAAVLELARRPGTSAAIGSRDAVLELGAKTIRAVAQSLHPEVKDPLWQFTVPEAFALVERVSRRLRVYTVDNIPLGEHLTVAQILAVYRWRGALGVAERAYDVWRIARLANPVAAVTHELRERLSKQVLEAGRAHITDRLVDTYVKEVGRAAIDLYGGRLKISSEHLNSMISTASTADEAAISARANEPLRILVIGQSGAGKTSLISALIDGRAGDVFARSASYVPHLLRRPNFPKALIIDTPGLDGSERHLKTLAERAADCDLVLCVIHALRDDGLSERGAIDAVRHRFSQMPNRIAPTVVTVVTHIDLLPPADVWHPPYDLTESAVPKVASIVGEAEAVFRRLEVHRENIVPISLKRAAQFNVDAVWDRLAEILPDAQSAQLARQLAHGTGGWRLKKIFSQTVMAGKALGGSFRS